MGGRAGKGCWEVWACSRGSYISSCPLGVSIPSHPTVAWVWYPGGGYHPNLGHGISGGRPGN